MPMIDLNDLWIGDKLLLVKSGRVGTFQGVNRTKARIKVNDKILLVPANKLELYVEAEPATPELIFEDEKSKPLSFHDFPTTIDLHIEKLAPEMVTQPAKAILNYQLNKLSEYIQQAELAGAKFLTIIHGKGTGVLRQEVRHYLNVREAVKFVLDKHDGGAVEVHLI